MNRLLLSAVTVVSAATLLTGCVSKTSGGVAPTTAASTEPTTTSAEGDAPRVTGTELSLEKYKAAPCSLLRPDQIARLGDMRPGEKRDRQGQPQCIWRSTAPTGKFSYTFTLSKSTLEDFYQKAKPQFPSFKPTEIAGYPGASYDGLGAQSGDCTTVVALSNQTDVLMVQVSNSTKTAENYKTPCVLSEGGAEIAVKGLN